MVGSDETPREVEGTKRRVGVPAATELIGRAAAFLVDKGQALLQFDLKNAFNAVSRSHMLDCVHESAPSFAPWADFLYKHQLPLVLSNGETILSQVGVQQGDPLGPLFFALASLPLAGEISQVQGVQWSAWYLDDGNIAGPPAALSACIEITKQKGPPLGLHLNCAETTITGTGLSQQLGVGDELPKILAATGSSGPARVRAHVKLAYSAGERPKAPVRSEP